MNVARKLKHRLDQFKSLAVYDLELVKERMTDWAQLQHYAQANAELGIEVDRVIFFGDSITDLWDLPSYFPNRSYVNRGICGQTTPQMLVRCRPDAIALHPKAIVLLAGTNDIAGNTGRVTLMHIQDNLKSIAELARYNQIQVILASVLPVSESKSITRPLNKIQALNDWIKQYCTDNNCIYLDYHSQMVNDRGFLPAHLSEDGLHPNDAGYRIMVPLVEAAIEELK